MRTFTGIPALAPAVGTVLGHSKWHPVPQRQIDQFAEATGDGQWLHVDPVRAAEGPFGSTIAHGYLTLSMIPVMLAEIFAIAEITSRVNYGADSLRFPSPAPVGSLLRAEATLNSLTPRPGGTLMSTHVKVKREGSEKPVCVVDILTVLTT